MSHRVARALLGVFCVALLASCGAAEPSPDRSGGVAGPALSPDPPAGGRDGVGAPDDAGAADGGAPSPPAPAGTATVSFLGVGQGDATLVQAPDATMLIDAGRHDRDDLVDLVRSRGVERIDVVAITHGHADHIGQLDRLLEAVEVGEVWMSGTAHTTRTFERALAAVERSGVAYEEPRAGDRTTVGSLVVEVVHPARLTGDLHADSLSLRIGYGSVSFLFTGDAEGHTEAEMTSRQRSLLAATVYQAGHHGSSTSTTQAFLDAVSPSVVVYSAGAGNSYGHPHGEVVNRVAAAGAELYGTDVHGTVTITTDGSSWTVATERAGTVAAGSGAPGTPRAPPVTSDGAGGAGCQANQVDVNSAPPDELQRIVHIGAERAEQLVGLRPFSSVDKLARISGIGDARLADIEAQGVACVA